MKGHRSVADRLVDRTVRLAAFISGLALLWLMGFTVFAVVMRYAFNAPILGAQDLSQVSLIAVVWPAMAYCGWTGGHVSLDLIGAGVERRSLRWVDCFNHIVCGLLFVLLSWRTSLSAVDAWEYQEASNLIEIPYAPFFFVIALSSILYALVLFVQAVRDLGRPQVATP